MNVTSVDVKCGEIWMCEIAKGLPNEQYGARPVFVFNVHAVRKWALIAPFASESIKLNRLSVNVFNREGNGILSNASDLLIDQTMPLDFDKFIFKIGEIDMQSKLYREIKRKAMRELLGIA